MENALETEVVAFGVQMHLVSINEAAQYLGLSVRTLRYWEAQGRMPSRIKFGRRMMYRLDELNSLSPQRGPHVSR